MPRLNTRNVEKSFTDLTNRYVSLAQCAFKIETSTFQDNLRKLVLPFYRNKEQHFWQKYLKFTYQAYAPLRVNSFPEVLSRIGTLFITGGIQSLLGFLGLILAFTFTHRLVSPSSSKPLDSSVYILIVFMLLQFLFFIFAAIKRWQVIWTERAYSIIVRILMGIGLVVLTIYAFLLPTVYGINGHPNYSELGNLYLTNAVATIFLVFLLVPSITFFYTNAIDIVVWICWLFPRIITTLMFFHSPFPAKRIHKLAFSDIKSPDGKSWKLANLPPAELNALEELATSNRVGTDKRLVPAVIILSLLQFLGWDWFIRILKFLWNTVLQSLISINIFSIMDIVLLVAISFVLALAFLMLESFAKLFSNLVAQSIIIETCITLRYGHKKQSSIRRPRKTAKQEALTTREKQNIRKS